MVDTNKRRLLFIPLILGWMFFCSTDTLLSYEIFIYRPYKTKHPLFAEKKLTLHGEFFGQLQFPSTYPSYNDLSGPEDRWTFGFQNRIFLTEEISFLAQLVTHDDGTQRTKFDWHFSLRINPFENLVLILGHDSNHDSDRQSRLEGFAYYLNRNYVGFGLPFQAGDLYIEPFTWFLYHTNHKGHLDLSGDNLIQEYGLRMGAWFEEKFGISFQIIAQSEAFFSLGQALLADLIFRIKLLNYLELSCGGSIWKDIQESRLGNKQTFYKLQWGIAIPF
jgi:hypothetical protein